ncbi:glycosyltransferase [Pacificimonas sp. WHA3]|uniref:Glycosyltransferase n=1 Tax=Pacificimonas pallii TaxID=2827236 RepID=A0ABS6SEV8_9SPHN|nr:glycosyltransferase [Pacificimonas pallii]MBV7256924.1 glycosyltransferase [Pacificimonas pallii]
MRVLLISGLFPPNAPTATVRPPKFARFLRERGDDVRVLAGQNLQFPAAVDPEIEPERILHVPYVRAGRSAPMTEADQPRHGSAKAAPAASGKPSWLHRMRANVWRVQQMPDPHRPWIDEAARTGAELAASWMPDIMVSTGPPHSSHIVAARLSKALGVPFIAELRDMWADNIYDQRRPIMEWIEMRMERRTLKGASGIVAVTDGVASRLADRYSVPVIKAANGYDPSDFAGREAPAALDEHKLTIVHAGSTYGGRRSPEPLFAALASMGDAAAGVRVIFYGEDAEVVSAIAERHGVTHVLETHGPIPRGEVLRIEREADILLLLRFGTEGEKHVVAGKLYEYAGARRPILCHGQTEGEAADLIRENDLGLVSNDTKAIAGWLRGKLAARAGGRLPDLPDGPALALTRDEQYARIAELMTHIVGTVKDG